MTTSWSRGPLRHLQYSAHDINSFHQLSKCCRGRCSCKLVLFELNHCRDLQFSYHILFIPFTEVVCGVLPSRGFQFVPPHQLLPKSLDVVLNHFGNSALHPARFVIFAQLAPLCIWIIVLIIPVLFLVRTCKIAQTMSDSIQHLMTSRFWLSGCQSHISSISDIFLLVLNRSICVFNSLSCHGGFSLHLIIEPLLIFFIAQKVRFWSFLRRKLLVGSQLHNAARAQTLAASKPHLPSFTWWRCDVECLVDLLYLPAGCSKKLFFRVLTILFCVDCVVGQDVGCWKIWTIWRQAASFMSRMVSYMNMNKAKSAFWPSLNWE